MKKTSILVALAFSLLASCGTQTGPQTTSVVGTWAGILTNSTAGASYPYRAELLPDGSAVVTNETGKRVSGEWSGNTETLTLKFLINTNNVVLTGQILNQNSYAGTAQIGRDSVGSFKFVRQ